MSRQVNPQIALTQKCTHDTISVPGECYKNASLGKGTTWWHVGKAAVNCPRMRGPLSYPRFTDEEFQKLGH